MDVEMLARNIQVIIAPVVMITSCAILLQGLLSRFSGISDRLQILANQRLELLYGEAAPDALRLARLELIEAQLPDLLRRHRLAHYACFALYCAIILFLASMFAIAAAASWVSAWSSALALFLFLAGTAVLLLGIVITALEARTAGRVTREAAARIAMLMEQV